MSLSIALHNIVVEFPENEYVITVNKSSDSDYEFVTLASPYKQTASYLFRWFRNMQSSCNPENAHVNVSAMVEVFQTQKEELFVSLREYVFEGIILTCYRLQIEDNDLICKVLNMMYACWLSFGPLHFKAILGRYKRQKGKNSKDLLTYFLEHARRKRLEFNGVRMIDVSIYSCIKKSPVFLAADVWGWKQMLIFLQYGAMCEKLFQDPTKSFYGISSALTEILRTLLRHLWYRVVHPGYFLINEDENTVLEYCSNLDAEVKQLCLTFNILLRAVRRIQFGSLEYMIKDINEQNTIILVNSRDVMTHCTVTNTIPKLFKRYECPEELKHCCRWMIRKRLNENWQLPNGIQDLPIPRKMKRYLNLLTD